MNKKFRLYYYGCMVPQVELFLFVFLQELRHHRDISKLTDLYRGGKIIFPSKPSLLAVQPKEELTLPKNNKEEQKSKSFVVPSWFTKLTQRYVERQRRTTKGLVM